MSVASALQIPDQPAAGLTEIIPMGGDGFTAPHQAQVATVQLAGDAGGGSSLITIRLDERYTNLVSVVSANITGAAANTNYLLDLQMTAFEVYRILGFLTFVSFGGAITGALNSVLWTPPPVLAIAPPGLASAPPLVRFGTANVDGDTNLLSVRVYCFDKRARELTPLNVLLASVPRASALINGT